MKRPPVLTMPSLVLCTLLAGLASPALAQLEMTHSPTQPVDAEATFLIVEGDHGCSGPHGLLGWQLDDRTFRVEIESVTSCVLSPPMSQPFRYVVDLGVLSAGAYEVEIWSFSSIDPSQPGSLAHESEFEVVPAWPEPPQGASHLATVPTFPTDKGPVTLSIFGSYPCAPKSRLLGWQRLGDTFRVEITGRPDCGSVNPPHPFAHAVELGDLPPPGSYSVETWVYPELEDDPTPRLDRTSTLRVYLGIGLLVPERATSRDPVTITVAGEAVCPIFDTPRIEGRTVIVPYQEVHCVRPVGEIRLDFEVGPLPAGTVSVELRRVNDDWLVDREEIQVLQDPVELADGAFRLDVTWTTSDGTTGRGRPVQPPSADSALYWFFAPANWELMVKVLDGCAVNGHRWVFAAASTDVQYTLSVEETASGDVWTRTHPGGTAAPAIADTSAFACD